MSSPLSTIPAPRRRQFAATLGLFAVLFVAVGAVAATGANTPVIQVFVVVALLVALVLALLAWGVANSVRIERADATAEQQLDAAIEAAVAATGASMCGCGQEHDPTVLHVPDDPCARDGHGEGCTHSCQTCILSTLRSTEARGMAVPPARPTPGARRPSPTPR